MATSNVDYYENQKHLLEDMHENEQRRLQLERQLQAYCKSDQKLAKLRAVKLQSYLKRISEDEKRSQQRNTQLMKDLDRVEKNMTDLAAKRERLRLLKEQYESFIDRTYPQWIQLVLQQRQQRQQQEEQKQQRRQQQLQEQQRQQQLQQQQQQQERQQQLQWQEQQRQQQLQQQQQQQQQYWEQQRFAQQSERTGVPQGSPHARRSPPTLPSEPPPPPPQFSSKYDDDVTPYVNIKQTERKRSVSPPLIPTPKVTVHMPVATEEELTPPTHHRPVPGSEETERKTLEPPQGWAVAERDTSFSEEFDDERISQPIQSVTVRQKQAALQKSMEPLSDEEISDFGDDVEIPMSPRQPPPSQQQQEVKDMSPNSSPAESPSPAPIAMVLEKESQKPPSPVHPELQTNGLYQLLKLVETELSSALTLDGFYRTHHPSPGQRKDIIHKANHDGRLSGLDAELVSMVILDQITPIIRNTDNGCLLPDSLLSGNINIITEQQIRMRLQPGSQMLWSKLMDHFIVLVRNKVMSAREVAYIFVPCLAQDPSQLHNKACTLLTRLLEQLSATNMNGRVSPPDTSLLDSQLDTGRSTSRDQAVPPLKFGSLVDKPLSDEESSMFTQSIPTEGPKVPLNETEAYKHLLSGSIGASRPKHMAPADDDTDEDDVEKQFVSGLTPRSHASRQPVDKPVSPRTPAPHGQSHDLESPRSDRDSLSPLASPVYVPTGVEPSSLRSGLGSTGGSGAKPGKIAGVKIDSDLESEPDIDNLLTGKKQSGDDNDDFFDFYE